MASYLGDETISRTEGHVGTSWTRPRWRRCATWLSGWGGASAANLEFLGHLVRGVDPDGGRGIRVTLTETGRQLLAESNARSTAYLRWASVKQ